MRRRLLTERAILQMKRGEPIDLFLFAQLAELGVDVEALSRRYSA